MSNRCTDESYHTIVLGDIRSERTDRCLLSGLFSGLARALALSSRNCRGEKKGRWSQPRRVSWRADELAGPPDAYENSWAPEVKGSWYPYSENGVVNIKRAPLCVATNTRAHARTHARYGEHSHGEGARVQCALHACIRGARVSRGRHCSLACDDRRSSRPLSFSSRSIWKGCDSGCNSRRRERPAADYSEIAGRYDAIRVLILSHGACSSGR